MKKITKIRQYLPELSKKIKMSRFLWTTIGQTHFRDAFIGDMVYFQAHVESATPPLLLQKTLRICANLTMADVGWARVHPWLYASGRSSDALFTNDFGEDLY